MEDSDTENECFESAEESLDEDEKNDVCAKAKSDFLEGGSKSSEPVRAEDNTVSLGQQLNEETNVNLMSYRKRPERVKRLLSKPSNKNESKSSDAPIFKADKIIPDAFLQDIASNLSKNINKSLSTLQQKSSNVKDMIFSSLPVSSLNHSEGFSYDDKNMLSTSADTPQDNENFQFAGDGENNIEKKQDNVVGKPSAEDMSFPPEAGQSDGEELNFKKSNSDNSSNEFQELDNKVSEEIDEKEDIEPEFKENHVSFSNACFIAEDVKETENDRNSDEAMSMTETVNSESSEPSRTGDSCNSNISKPTDQNFKSVDTNVIDVNNFTQNLNLQNIKSNATNPPSDEPTLNKRNEDEENSTGEEENLLPMLNKSSNNDIDLKSSENIDTSESLKTSAVISSGEVCSEQHNPDSECNFKELKTALKNIIKDEENLIENPNSLDAIEKTELTCEKNIVEDLVSKDGWDDFDFSDVEDENIAFKEEISQNIDVKIKDKALHNEPSWNSVPDFCMKPISHEIDNEGNNSNNEFKKGSTKTNLINSSSQVSLKKSSEQNLVNNNNKMVEKDKEKENEEIIKNNDGWDWDAWEEESEETNNAETTNSECDEPKEKISDLSKWSGWDNFGQKSEEKPGNWGLGSWGVDMLLNKATAVTQGISNVLEAGLGAPDPETLARMEKMERENLRKERKQEIDSDDQPLEVTKKNSLSNVNLFPVSGLTSLVAGVTSKIVEHSKIQEIGSKVITGGLDTLETFGKKTMEVLQEGDPGLKNKRAFLLGDKKPMMSQLLREAREIAEREIKMAEERESAKKYNFEALFDDYQGMVHLEALEMLSTQYELKLEQLRSGMKPDEQEDFNSILEEVEQLCSFDETDMDFKASSNLDFKIKLERAIEPLKNEISIQKILQIHAGATNWLQTPQETKPSLRTVHQKLVSTLAELAAATVQQFHKSGELLSVKECRKTVEETDSLLRFTNVLCTEINILGEKFITYSKKLDRKESNDETLNSLFQNVNIIMTNSVSYIRQAFNLLIPVLQFGAAVY